jgi:hypothetical protein
MSTNNWLEWKGTSAVSGRGKKLEEWQKRLRNTDIRGTTLVAARYSSRTAAESQSFNICRRPEHWLLLPVFQYLTFVSAQVMTSTVL